MKPLVVSSKELSAVIHEQLEGRWWPVSGDPRHLPDLARGNYVLPKKKYVEWFLYYSKVDEIMREDAFKCDSYAVNLWAEWRKFGALDIWNNKYPFAGGMFRSVHALNWVVDEAGVLWIIEPQKDWLMLPQPRNIRPAHWDIHFMAG